LAGISPFDPDFGKTRIMGTILIADEMSKIPATSAFQLCALPTALEGLTPYRLFAVYQIRFSAIKLSWSRNNSSCCALSVAFQNE
jgi:hypothetical protein